MRTILDLLEGVPPATLRQALREGLRRGFIRRSEIAEARRHLGTRERFFRSSRLMEPKRYATAAAFRMALEDRLQDIARKEGVEIFSRQTICMLVTA